MIKNGAKKLINKINNIYRKLTIRDNFLMSGMLKVITDVKIIDNKTHEYKLAVSKNCKEIKPENKKLLDGMMALHINYMIKDVFGNLNDECAIDYLINELSIDYCIMCVILNNKQTKLKTMLPKNNFSKFAEGLIRAQNIYTTKNYIKGFNGVFFFKIKELITLIIYMRRMCNDDKLLSEIADKFINDTEYIMFALIILGRKMYFHDVPYYNRDYAKQYNLDLETLNKMEVEIFSHINLYITYDEFKTATHLETMMSDNKMVRKAFEL